MIKHLPSTGIPLKSFTMPFTCRLPAGMTPVIQAGSPDARDWSAQLTLPPSNAVFFHRNSQTLFARDARKVIEKGADHSTFNSTSWSESAFTFSSAHFCKLTCTDPWAALELPPPYVRTPASPESVAGERSVTRSHQHDRQGAGMTQRQAIQTLVSEPQLNRVDPFSASTDKALPSSSMPPHSPLHLTKGSTYPLLERLNRQRALRWKALRMKMGMPQAAFAEKIGVPSMTVSMWERGTAGHRTTQLVPFARALDVEPEALAAYLHGEISLRTFLDQSPSLSVYERHSRAEKKIHWKALRTAMGMSQASFAEKIGVSQGTVSRWERGVSENRVSHVKSAAKALDVRLEDLDAYLRGDISLATFLDRAPSLSEYARDTSTLAFLSADTGGVAKRLSPAEEGMRWKALRMAMGMSQASFAEKIGIGKITVSRWERGTAGYRTRQLVPFAKALGVEPNDLAAYLRGEIPLMTFLDQSPSLNKQEPRSPAEDGIRWKDLRTAMDMSQASFAEKIGVARITVSRWERGAAGHRVSHLKSAAKAFDVRREDLAAYLRGELSLMTFLDQSPSLSEYARDTSTLAFLSADTGGVAKRLSPAEEGMRWKALRMAMDMSQASFAEKIGIVKITISRWERGAAGHRLSPLQSAAKALDVEQNELVAYLRGDIPLATFLDLSPSLSEYAPDTSTLAFLSADVGAVIKRLSSTEEGMRWKDLRVAMGMSQASFAEKIVVSKITVSRWERGVAGYRISQLVPFARALDVEPKVLAAYLRGDISLATFLDQSPSLSVYER